MNVRATLPLLILAGTILGVITAYVVDAHILLSPRNYFLTGQPDAIPTAMTVRGLVRSVDQEQKKLEFEMINPYNYTEMMRVGVTLSSTTIIRSPDTGGAQTFGSSPEKLFQLAKDTIINARIARENGNVRALMITIGNQKL